MSVSIDDEVAEGGEDARGVLASWLDDYSEGRCDLEDVRDSFLSVCRSDPDAPWDALALLDQYTRRGRIEPDLAQSLKSEIEKLVFGVGQSPATLRRSPPTTAKSEPLRTDPASDDEDLSDDEAPDEGDLVRPKSDSTFDLTPDQAASQPVRRFARCITRSFWRERCDRPVAKVDGRARFGDDSARDGVHRTYGVA